MGLPALIEEIMPLEVVRQDRISTAKFPAKRFPWHKFMEAIVYVLSETAQRRPTGDRFYLKFNDKIIYDPDGPQERAYHEAVR